MPIRQTVLAALVVTLSATSLAAQDATPGMNRRRVSPIAMQGPPEPTAFAAAIGLDTAQTTRYGHLRNAYLTATKVERDSLGAMRGRMRAMRGTGQGAGAAGMPAAGPGAGGMQAMRPLVDSLEARFRDFETDLEFLLTADQHARYVAWKAAEETRMRQEAMERRQ